MVTPEPVFDKPIQTGPFRSLRGTYFRESIVKSLLVLCGSLSIFTTLAIVVVLFFEASQFFRAGTVTCPQCRHAARSTLETAGQEIPCTECGHNLQMPAHISLWGFLTGTEWNPLIGKEQDKRFGVWALISGTLMVSFVAMLFALPLGLITAIYLSEYAHPKTRMILKPSLEVLAGIPTVVFGFFALTVITPTLQLPFFSWFLGEFNTYNALSAGIAVGILCLPIVSSLVEDALQAVPRSLREGAYGLGATKFDVSIKVVVPAALSGIISAFLLAVSRTVGETMIVALAAGSRPHLTLDPRDDTQTMTGWMVQMALGDVSNFDLAYLSMYAVAAVLFVMTLALTYVGNVVRWRFREVYQ
ncbi:MAG TPA: phosphate ABC transporter permease subunit PstC [Pirellulaceae bacterium]|nr:phosphate ABC transporter permease subunit PstC [Pirellulaceae bacterium]